MMKSVLVFSVLVGPGFAGKFWHVSDLHLDYNYNVNGDVKQMCHLNSNSTNNQPLSQAGNYSCDAPPLLVKSILKAMQLIEPNPDFIVWTGDNGPHTGKPYPSYQYITKVMRFVYKEIKTLFKDVPVISALGNHDSDPPDTFAYNEDIDSPTSQYQKYFEDGGFSDQITEEKDKNTFLQCGYYTQTISKKETVLKFVVLNTNLYYNNNANFTDKEDPCNQLAWLNQTLVNTERDAKVYIVSHVPPGGFERKPDASFFNSPKGFGEQIEKNYVSLLVAPGIHEKIHAHLYGHVHTDSFRLFLSRSGDDEVRGVGFLGSSGTPLLWRTNNNMGTNPAIRLFEFKEEDGSLQDYSQYGLMLDQLDLTSKAKSRRKNLDESESSRKKRDNPDPVPVPTSRTDRNSKLLDLNTTYPATKDNSQNVDGAVEEQGTSSKDVKTEESPVDDTKMPTEEAPKVDDAKTSTEEASEIDEEPTKATGSKDVEASTTAVASNEEVTTKETETKEASTDAVVARGDISVETEKSETAAQGNVTLVPSKTGDLVDSGVDNSTNSTGKSAENASPEEAKEENSTQSTAAVSGDLSVATEKASITDDDGKGAEIDLTEGMQDSLVKLIAQNFTLIYKATEAFKVANLSAEEMGRAYNSMTPNSTIFQNYYKHNTVNRELADEPCNAVCYRQHMCTIKEQIFEELTSCINSATKLTVVINATPASPVTEPQPTAPVHIPRTNFPTPAPPVEITTVVPPKPIPTPIPTPSTPIEEEAKKVEEEIEKNMSEAVSKVLKEPVQTSDGVKSKVAGIFFGVSGALIILIIAGFSIRKYRQRRNNDQEFLLTDSVFRYDGYSQLDDQF